MTIKKTVAITMMMKKTMKNIGDNDDEND